MVREGALEAVLPDGRRLAIGDGSPPRVVVAVRDPVWLARIILNPEVVVGHMVLQLQLAKKIDAVPLTRSYIESSERDLVTMWRSAA